MNTDELVARAKVDGALPKTLNYSDDNIVDALNAEITAYIVPLLLGAKGNYLDDVQDIPLVGGQQAYDIPSRALFSKVRLVSYVDAGGTESKPLKYVEGVDIHDYAASGVPTGFFFLPGQIALLPTPVDATGSLRVRYPRRPGKLVRSILDGAGKQTTVAVVDHVVDGVQTAQVYAQQNIAGAITATDIDISAPLSPFKLRVKDLVVTATGLNYFTVFAGTPDTTYGVAKGDYVTAVRTSYIPQIPQEFHELLLLRGVARLHDNAKDLEARNSALQRANEMAKLFGAMADPRADQNPHRLSAWRGHRRRWGWR